jgi:uncharacterized protein (TIRG00374 family)
MTKGTVVGIVAGIGLSTGGLLYTFHGVDMAAMRSGMGRVGATWILLSVLVALFSFLLRAVRWRVLLRDVKTVGTGPLLSATFIGMFANNVLPARIGELVRAWVLARRERTPVPAVFSTIVVERFLDVVAALLILVLGLAAAPNLGVAASTLLMQTLVAVTLLVGIGLVGLVMVVRFRKVLMAGCERLSNRSSRRWVVTSLGLFQRLLTGLPRFRGGGEVLAIVGLSLVIWAPGVLSFHLLAKGFELGLTLAQTSLIFVIVLFGVAIPSAPGFIGTFHGFCVAGLVLVAGTEPTVAAAYATLLHGTQWMAVNIIGLGYLVAEPAVTWTDLTAALRLRKPVALP